MSLTKGLLLLGGAWVCSYGALRFCVDKGYDKRYKAIEVLNAVVMSPFIPLDWFLNRFFTNMKAEEDYQRMADEEIRKHYTQNGIN